MVQFVNVRELKNRVSEVIRRSRKGVVVVTSRGKPQAVLHAVREEDLEDYLLANSPKSIKGLEASYREYRWKGGAGVVRDKTSVSYGDRGQKKMRHRIELPIIVEKDEEGFYVIECPLFSGCYTQGKTLGEALRNIHEVIGLCLEEKENQDRLRSYHPRELSFHTLLYA
jgi:prevent-host-death family protein